MLINKFEYVDLKRINNPAGRQYLDNSGTAVPSVTTILAATKSAESKQALLDWKARVGEKQAQAITTEAAGRGTRLHKWLENYVKTGETGDPGTNPYSIQSHSMAKEIISKGLIHCSEFWGTEVPVCYSGLYAGTTDLVGVHQQSAAILDFKQTNKPKKREWIEDYFLQTAAYAAAHNDQYGTDIKKGVILMCSAAGEYQEFIIQGDEFEHYAQIWARRVEQYYSKLY
jgi:genome maintenance exonuclease 1